MRLQTKFMIIIGFSTLIAVALFFLIAHSYENSEHKIIDNKNIEELDVNLLHSEDWNSTLEDGAIVWFDFDETSGTNVINKVGGTAKNGTIIGTITQNASAGDFGRCYNFSGGGWINLTGLTSTTQTYTISTWINPHNVSGEQVGFDTQTGRLLLYFASAGATSGNAGYYDGAVRNFGIKMNTTNMKHYVWTFNSTGGMLFIDGVKSGSTLAYTARNIGGGVSIGSGYTAGDKINGLMCHFAIYNYSMNQNEINLLYNSGERLYWQQGIEEPPVEYNLTINSFLNDSLIIGQTWAGKQFSATSNVSINNWAVNDTTNFEINSTGFLINKEELEEKVYVLNISATDTEGKSDWALYKINVSWMDVSSFVITSNSNIEDTYGASQSGKMGVAWKVDLSNSTGDLRNITIKSVSKFSGSTSTTAYIQTNYSGGILANATFIGDVATFSTPVTIANNATYYILYDAGGASRTWRGRLSVTMPIADNNGTYITSVNQVGGNDTANFVEVKNVTYEYWQGSDRPINYNVTMISDNSSTFYPYTNNNVFHSAYFQTNATLSTYIFSINQTGSFNNDTAVALSGSQSWTNVTKLIDAVKNTNVQWIIYVNDSEGKVIDTSVQSYTVINSIPQILNTIINETSILQNQSVKINVTLSDRDGLDDINSVIATIKSPSDSLLSLNVSLVNYTKYEHNPIDLIVENLKCPQGEPHHTEFAPRYIDGKLHAIYRVCQNPNNNLAYSTSYNGLNWTKATNLTLNGNSTGFWGYSFPDYKLIDGVYYMTAGHKDDYNVRLFNSTDGINWNYACGADGKILIGTFFNAEIHKLPDNNYGMYVSTGGGASWQVNYYNSSNLCGTWTSQGNTGLGNAEGTWSKYINSKWIVYYGDRINDGDIWVPSIATGDSMGNVSVARRAIIRSDTAYENYPGGIITGSYVVEIPEINPNFSSKFYMYYDGNHNVTGVAWDSLGRTFEEAHFSGVSTYYNITLTRDGTTNSWINTFTNTSETGIYNITALYAYDGDDTNYTTYNNLGFEVTAKPSPTLSLTFDKTSPQNYGTTINASCTTDSDGTLKLWRNGTDVTLSEMNQQTLLPIGTHTYVCNVTETDSYSSGTTTEDFIILDNVAPVITVTSNPTITSLYQNHTINFTVSDDNLDKVWYEYGVCYQESANTSNQKGTDGDCGLNYTGSYFYDDGDGFFGGAGDRSLMIDGDWETGIYSQRLIINYTKPINKNKAIWQVKDDGGIANLTIPDSCFNASAKIQLRMLTTGGVLDLHSTSQCFNGTGWITLQSVFTGFVYNTIYEEGIYWYYGGEVPTTSGVPTSINFPLVKDIYTATIYANDTVGNLATETVTLTFDSTAPTISASVNSTITAEGDKLLLNTTVTDDNLDKCWYTYNGVNTTITGCQSGILNQTTITTTLSALSLRVWANDTAGNINSQLVSLEVDEDAPIITIQSGNGTQDYGSLLQNHTINFTVTDDNLDKVYVRYIASTQYNSSLTTLFDGDRETMALIPEASSNGKIYNFALNGNGAGYLNITRKGTSVGCSPNPKYIQEIIPLNGDGRNFYINISRAGSGEPYVYKFYQNNSYIGEIIIETIGFCFTYPTEIEYYEKINVTSGVPASTSFSLVKDIYEATIYANDTVGNIASEVVNWSYRAIQLDESFNNNILSGSINPFVTNIETNGTPITVAYLNYNGVNYLGSINSTGNIYTLTRNQLASDSGSIPFYWNITQSGFNFVTESQSQTVIPLGISSVCTGNYTIFNMTLLDEVTMNKINATLKNSLVKVHMKIYSSTRILLSEYYTEFSRVNPAAICINNNMSSGESYSIDLQIQYSADNYTSELYHIERYILNQSTLNNNISLYILDEDNTQKFKLITRDSAYLPISNALIQIERKYIQNGTFYITEIPKTDERGVTSASLQVNDVIYNFIIYQNGTRIFGVNDVLAICQNPLISQCEIDFNAVVSEIKIPNYEEGDDFNFTLGYNKTSRRITSQFVIPSGEPSAVQLVVSTTDSLGTTICTDSITSASGTLICDIDTSFGNSTITAKLYKDGIEQGYGTQKLDQSSRDIFGVILIFISILVMMTLVGIGISDNPVVTGAFLFIGVLLIYAMNIVDSTGFIGSTATILFLAIAILLVIIKAARRT
jgi:hypothetical protein